MDVEALIIAIVGGIVLFGFLLLVINLLLPKVGRKKSFLILKMIAEAGVIAFSIYNGITTKEWGTLEATVLIVAMLDIWQSISEMIEPKKESSRK